MEPFNCSPNWPLLLQAEVALQEAPEDREHVEKVLRLV